MRERETEYVYERLPNWQPVQDVKYNKKRLENIFFMYKYLNGDFKLLDHSVIESTPLSSVLALSQTAFGAVSILGTLMC